MSLKITPDHLARAAVVYIRQSTPAQVLGNLESQRRQYALVAAAQTAGFAAVTTIDDDLGRSGSGLVVRPGFQKLVATVCEGRLGAVYCLPKVVAGVIFRDGTEVIARPDHRAA